MNEGIVYFFIKKNEIMSHQMPRKENTRNKNKPQLLDIGLDQSHRP